MYGRGFALFAGVLLLCAGLQPLHAASKDEHPTPLVVRADGLRLSEGVIAMARGSTIFVPVRALALAFEFPIELDADAGRARGWFLDPARRYVIDARNGRVESEGQSQSFAPDDFLLGNLARRQELYVQPHVLERVWPVRLSVSQADLALEVEPVEPLPVQQRRERKQRRERLRNRRAPMQADLPLQQHPYGWFSAPAIGIDIQAQSGGGRRAVRESVRWAQEIAGVNVAAGVFASGPSLSESRVEDARLTLQRFARDDSWPGGVRRVAVGDVAGESFSRIGSVGQGRGLTLSSFPLVRGNAYDLFALEGEAPPGWEAELYRDGYLMDFQRVTEEGRYRFAGIELGYGLNRLRVVLYGPQGQVRERTEVVDVGQTQARPGETHFRIDHVEVGRDFIEVGEENDAAAAARAGTSLRAVHGVSRGLSVEAGLIEMPATRRMPPSQYALFGVAGALGPTATRVRLLGQQDGGSGIDLDTRLRAGPVALRAGAAAFEQFESPRVGFGGSALRRDFDVAASVPVPLGETRVRLGARYAVATTVSGTERHRLNLSQRWNTGRIAWHHSVDIRRSGAGNRRWSADLDASDRWFFGAGKSLLWGAGLSYAQDVGVTDARLRSRYLLSRATTVGFQVRGSPLTGNATTGIDLTRRWDAARLSLTLDGGDVAETRLGLRFSVGFGPDGAGGYSLASPQAPSRGAVAVHAFVDRDGDGRYDEGEPPVPEAKLQHPLNGEATDHAGRATLNHLEAHRTYAVRLDPDSLVNPFWMPASKGRMIKVRPGSVPVVRLPVQATASISGTVQLAETGGSAPGVPLRLVNGSGETVAQTRTIFGGFYSFDHVPYGAYRLRIDGQGYSLDGAPVAVTASHEHPMVAGLDVSVIPRSTLAPSGQRVATSDASGKEGGRATQ